MKIWEPKPPGTLWATLGLLRDYFTFYMYYLNLNTCVLKIILEHNFKGIIR